MLTSAAVDARCLRRACAAKLAASGGDTGRGGGGGGGGGDGVGEGSVEVGGVLDELVEIGEGEYEDGARVLQRGEGVKGGGEGG